MCWGLRYLKIGKEKRKLLAETGEEASPPAISQQGGKPTSSKTRYRDMNQHNRASGVKCGPKKIRTERIGKEAGPPGQVQAFHRPRPVGGYHDTTHTQSTAARQSQKKARCVSGGDCGNAEGNEGGDATPQGLLAAAKGINVRRGGRERKS